MVAFSKHNSFVVLERDWLLLLEPTNRVYLLTRHRATVARNNCVALERDWLLLLEPTNRVRLLIRHHATVARCLVNVCIMFIVGQLKGAIEKYFSFLDIVNLL